MKELSKRQQEIYDFMKNFFVKNGCQASNMEIAEHFGVSRHYITIVLRILVKKGFIENTQGKHKSYKFAGFNVKLEKCTDEVL